MMIVRRKQTRNNQEICRTDKAQAFGEQLTSFAHDGILTKQYKRFRNAI